MIASRAELLVEDAHDRDMASPGLDGASIEALLEGGCRQGHDPLRLLDAAGIARETYGNSERAIDGRALFRLVRQVQLALDDVYLGFLEQGSRLALESERMNSLMHAGDLGEALRVSVRFTNAMAPDVGATIEPCEPGCLLHRCAYRTTEGVDRSILVWIRFVWIYHFFGWLIGRRLELRRMLISGPPPREANGFDRYALFGCPVQFGAPLDGLVYSWKDLRRPIIRHSAQEYEAYCTSEPDWLEGYRDAPNWSERTRQAIITMQRRGQWAPSIEEVGTQLGTNARRLRHNLAAEGEAFQRLRTRLRGELAGAFLLASDLTIQQICALLGFSEPAAFSRSFVAWAGISPGLYRERFAGDAARIAASCHLLAERRPVDQAAAR